MREKGERKADQSPEVQAKVKNTPKPDPKPVSGYALSLVVHFLRESRRDRKGKLESESNK